MVNSDFFDPFFVEQFVENYQISRDKKNIPRNSSFFFDLKLRCDECFTHAFIACVCVFKEIMLVGLNQGNYFKKATECSLSLRFPQICFTPTRNLFISKLRKRNQG